MSEMIKCQSCIFSTEQAALRPERLHDCLCVLHHIDMMKNTLLGPKIMWKESGKEAEKSPSQPSLLGPKNFHAIGFADRSPRVTDVWQSIHTWVHGSTHRGITLIRSYHQSSKLPAGRPNPPGHFGSAWLIKKCRNTQMSVRKTARGRFREEDEKKRGCSD